jgi:adenosylcobyric acid synthase
MTALAVLGTSSWAGKSLLTTALARWFARRGTRVAPFKAHNMSNNARVVAGGEIGSAQYLQALAAGIEPDVRMNPVLTKPEGQERSQVIVTGRVDETLSAMPWRDRSSSMRAAVDAAFISLRADHDLILIEGAGSPAEINLGDTDLANVRMLELADAQAVIVCDIDRGGAFAHLYGTWALLTAGARARVGGFVLNRFRGDAALLAPGPRLLEGMTGVPTVGVLPMLRHDLPDEDGADTPVGSQPDAPAVGIVRYPTASNLDEFRPLRQVARLRWLEHPASMEEVDLVILPGSKHVGLDLDWLRARGFDGGLRRRAAQGGLILGICGGMQMLGRRLSDPAGVDIAAEGLGLLPLETTFATEKLVRPVDFMFPPLPDAWHVLTGVEVRGYEIRHGRSSIDGGAVIAEELGVGIGSVLGLSAHGILEDPMVLKLLFGRAPGRSLEDTFELLADAVEEHLDTDRILSLVGEAS